MAQLYLPVAHTEADLVLAGQIAELIDSAELYVAWTAEEGAAVPEVAAELRPTAPHWTGTLALVVHAVHHLLAAMFTRGPQRAALAPAKRDAPDEQPAAQ
jgi:hypothetical protein